MMLVINLTNFEDHRVMGGMTVVSERMQGEKNLGYRNGSKEAHEEV